MKDKDKEEYERLVELYSSKYKTLVGNLFTLEELKQQAWLGILEAVSPETADDKIAYVSQSIKNKIIDMLIQEIKHRAAVATTTDGINTDIPEDIIISKELVEKLRIKIQKVPLANFVLTHMNTLSVRDISELARSEGIDVSKSAVHKIVCLIRKEFSKIMEA